MSLLLNHFEKNTHLIVASVKSYCNPNHVRIFLHLVNLVLEIRWFHGMGGGTVLNTPHELCLTHYWSCLLHPMWFYVKPCRIIPLLHDLQNIFIFLLCMFCFTLILNPTPFSIKKWYLPSTQFSTLSNKNIIFI